MTFPRGSLGSGIVCEDYDVSSGRMIGFFCDTAANIAPAKTEDDLVRYNREKDEAEDRAALIVKLLNAR